MRFILELGVEHHDLISAVAGVAFREVDARLVLVAEELVVIVNDVAAELVDGQEPELFDRLELVDFQERELGNDRKDVLPIW